MMHHRTINLQITRTSNLDLRKNREISISNLLPEAKHEKEILKSVADQIYSLLNSPQKVAYAVSEGQNAGDMILSALSAVVDLDTMPIEDQSAARISETLSHFVADDTPKHKREDKLDISPNVNTQLLRNSRTSFMDMIKSKFGITTSKPTGSPTTKPVNRAADETVESKEMLMEAPDAQVVPAKNVPSSLSKDAIYTSSFDTKSESKGGPSGIPAADDNSILHLTPHVVFTDREGRQYSLMGVGGHASADCSRQCLGVDDSSKKVLAYQQPTSSEFLVLVNPDGSHVFTSGVQMCTSENFGEVGMRAPDLSLLHPQLKRTAGRKEANGISVRWKDAYARPILKREHKNRHDEFGEDLDTLYNGVGLNGEADKRFAIMPKDALKSVALKTRKSRRKRQKEAAVLRRRRRYHAKRKHMNKFQNHNRRRLQDPDYIDEDYDRIADGDSGESSNPLQSKLLHDLGKYNNYEEYSKGGKTQIDVDRCKRHCESVRAHIDRLTDLEDSLESARSKRQTTFDLLPRRNMYNSVDENGTCIDCLFNGHSNMDADKIRPAMKETDYRIFTFDPAERNKGEVLNSPVNDEEFNMIQPTSSSDDEDKILLQTENAYLPFLYNMKNEVGSLQEVRETPGKNVGKSDVKLDDKYGPDSANLEWAAIPLEEGTTYRYQAVTEVDDSKRNISIPAEAPREPVEWVVSNRLEEVVKDHVKNSDEMNQILAPALDFPPPVTLSLDASIPPPQYSSAFSVLMKAFLVNIEKLTEAELAVRNCEQLTDDLQEYLEQILFLPAHTNPVQEYHENIEHVPSFEALAVRKDKLVDLLKEFGQMSPKEQDASQGVKNFIETELNTVGNDLQAPMPKPDVGRYVRSQKIDEENPELKKYEKKARQWYESVKKNVNAFRAKPFAEPKPYPQSDEHATVPTA